MKKNKSKAGEKVDMVDHPPHYGKHPSGIECIDVIEHMPLNIGTAIKYCWRMDLKTGVEGDQDLDKAIWFLKREKLRRSKFKNRN